jgi:hypothetical protein
MRKAGLLLAIVAMAPVVPGLVMAEQVDVIISGTVVFNAIGDPPLSAVSGGDAVSIYFILDSENFVEGVPGDTRGYVIDQASFAVEFDTPVIQGLLDPFPAGQTPYFTLVEGFPVSDGFFVATFPTSPGGVPLEQTPFNANFSVSYVGETLDSLDILDAEGVYDFTGLTAFGFNLWSIFPDNVAMEIDFEQMTIQTDAIGDGGSDVPATSNAGLLILIAIVLAGTIVVLRRSRTA